MLRNRMRSKSIILVWLSVFCIVIFSVVSRSSVVEADPVEPEDRLFAGIVINEILSDPSTGVDGCESNNTGVDTNANGCFNQADDFVELYNGLDEPIEIGTWSLWTNEGEEIFTFPDGAEIAGYGYVLIIADWDENITGETTTLNGAVVYSADRPEGILIDTGDNVILFDPDFEEYIHAYYTGAGASQAEPIDDPTSSYPDVFEDAFLIGSVDDFGVAEAGISQVRRFSADTEILKHTDVDGQAASPGDHYTAVTLSHIISHTIIQGEPFSLMFTVLLVISTLYVLQPAVRKSKLINNEANHER